MRRASPASIWPGASRSDAEHFWNPVWVRFRRPEDVRASALAHCLLAYASDMRMVSSSALPHRDSVPRTQLQMASLDHALWFHRRFAIDEWLLFVRRSSTAVGARGMNHAEFFSVDGRLIASVSQEGLLRPSAPQA